MASPSQVSKLELHIPTRERRPFFRQAHCALRHQIFLGAGSYGLRLLFTGRRRRRQASFGQISHSFQIPEKGERFRWRLWRQHRIEKPSCVLKEKLIPLPPGRLWRRFARPWEIVFERAWLFF